MTGEFVFEGLLMLNFLAFIAIDLLLARRLAGDLVRAQVPSPNWQSSAYLPLGSYALVEQAINQGQLSARQARRWRAGRQLRLVLAAGFVMVFIYNVASTRLDAFSYFLQSLITI